MKNTKTILFILYSVIAQTFTAQAENKNISGRVWFSFDDATYVIETKSQLVYLNRYSIPAALRPELSGVGNLVSLDVPASAIVAYDKENEGQAIGNLPMQNQPKLKVVGEGLILGGIVLADSTEQFLSLQVGNFIYRIDASLTDTETKAKLLKMGEFVEVRVPGRAVSFAFELPRENSLAVPKAETSGVAKHGDHLEVTGLANFSFSGEQFVVTVGDQIYQFGKESLSQQDIKKFDRVGTEIKIDIPIRMPAGAH